jgi:hypothetical protein
MSMTFMVYLISKMAHTRAARKNVVAMLMHMTNRIISASPL